jgi:S-adenosylmethionine:tRNA ribosyltransferase-isomerase
MHTHDHAVQNQDDIPAEFRLSSYVYELPPERIARRPVEQRDASRLMLVDRAADECRPAMFRDLPDMLAAKYPQGGLLVANNSKVYPARVFGHRKSGGRIELLLLTPLPLLHVEQSVDGRRSAEAEALVRTAKRMKLNETGDFGPDLSVTLLERGDFGRCRVRLDWRGEIDTILNNIGHMPLPPYLERPDEAADRERYQTTYADATRAGSVAAPTAGLHFTPEVRERLRARGFDWAEVTLYVGYGTFSPVRESDIRRHEMHAEHVEICEATAEKIRAAKAAGRPVIAVGTTSARSLEGAHALLGRVAAFNGETSIYITPGYAFRVLDGLITNFHLPESSLLIMVSALAGREKIMTAYGAALTEGFRFFSYGDAMLIV